MALICLITSLYACDVNNEKDSKSLSHQAGLQKSLQHLKEWKESRVPSQFFRIEVARDTVLVSNRGSWLAVPAHNFVDEKGKQIEGEVQLELVEVHTVTEAMQTGLSTLTINQQPLETAGMFFVNVTSSQARQVQYKQPIQLHTHTNVILPDVQLFEGKWVGDKLLWGNPQPIEKTMTKIPYEWVLNANGKRQQGYEEGNSSGQQEYYSQLTQMPQVDLKSCPIYIIERELIKNQVLFENSWISTEDFRIRINYLYPYCSVEPYLMYLEDLKNPLWKVDLSVANFLEKKGSDKIAANFRKLAEQKKTHLREMSATEKIMWNQFVEKAKQSVKILEKANGLDYPVSLSLLNNGWANLDFYLFSLEDTMTIENTIVDIELKVKTTRKNVPKGIELAAYLLFKEWNSAFLLEQNIATPSSFFQNITKLYKDTPYLLMVRDTKGKYIGIQEGVVQDSLIQANITVQPTTPALEMVIAAYMQVPERAKLVEDKEAVCCEGWEGDRGLDSLLQQ